MPHILVLCAHPDLRLSRVNHRLLEAAPFLADFGKPGRKHDGRPGAALSEFSDGLCDQRRRQGDYGKVRRFGNRGNCGITIECADTPIFGIHRIDGAGITFRKEILEGAAIDFAEVVGCAQDCDRSRGKQE